MLQLDGERIYLRDHQIDDLEAVHRWLSDPEVTRFIALRTTTREESLFKLAEYLRENTNPERRRFYFAVVLKTSEEIIGEAGLTIESRAAEGGGVADIGYFLLKPFWGQGYAAEAMRLLIAYGFNELKLHKVVAGCDARNVASARVMEKCGLAREGFHPRQRFLDGEWRDSLEYGLLRETWEQSQR